MDSLGIGQIITGTAHRDAIHVAIMPITAGERLYPGQRIGMVGGKATSQDPHLGIVDPFLAGAVFPDQRFYLCLFPGSITSLRHHWEHPALREDGPGPEAGTPSRPACPESEEWIREFADSVDLDYDELRAAAEDWIDGGHYLVGGDNLSGESVPDEFWAHYEAVTGRKVPKGKKSSFFRCSC